MTLEKIASRIAEEIQQVYPEYDYEVTLKGPFKQAHSMSADNFELEFEEDEGLLIQGPAYVQAMQEINGASPEELQGPQFHTFGIEVQNWYVDESDPSVGWGTVKGEKHYEAEDWVPVSVDGLALQNTSDVETVREFLSSRISRDTLREWGEQYQKTMNEMGP